MSPGLPSYENSAQISSKVLPLSHINPRGSRLFSCQICWGGRHNYKTLWCWRRLPLFCSQDLESLVAKWKRVYSPQALWSGICLAWKLRRQSGLLCTQPRGAPGRSVDHCSDTSDVIAFRPFQSFSGLCDQGGLELGLTHRGNAETGAGRWALRDRGNFKQFLCHKPKIKDTF